MMQLIAMALIGLIVGILARFLYPGRVQMGCIGSIALGIAGSYLAGLLGDLIHHRSVTELHPAGFFYSIVGAMLIIFIARKVSERR